MASSRTQTLIIVAIAGPPFFSRLLMLKLMHSSGGSLRLPLDLPSRGTLRVDPQVLARNRTVSPQPLSHHTPLFCGLHHLVPYHTFSTCLFADALV